MVRALQPATLDSFSAFAAAPVANPTDALGLLQNTIAAATPIVSAEVVPTKANAPSATATNAALQQFLQGNLPGYTLNSQGQLVPPSPSIPSWVVPAALAGVGGLVLLMFLRRR